MTTVPVLTGAKVMLRPARPDDVVQRLALGNDPNIMRMFGLDHDAPDMRASSPPLTIVES
jgi:hypothetical protein